MVRKEYLKLAQRRYRKEHPEFSILAKVKSRAKKNDVPFNLTIEDIVIPEFCPVLGLKLEFSREGRNGPSANSPSIDRLNPDLGYVKGNISFISHKANAAKSSLTLDQLKSLVSYVESGLKKEYGG